MKPRRAREPRLRDPETGEWDVAEVKHRTKGWVAVVLALVIVFGGIWFVGGKAWDAWMSFRTKDDYIGAGVDPIQVIQAEPFRRESALLVQLTSSRRSASSTTACAASSPRSITDRDRYCGACGELGTRGTGPAC